ncbi:glycosyltransferase family 4 protein [Candidatus Latescibacterota bacterium]
MRARVAHVTPTDRIAYLLLRARLTRLQQAGYGITVVCGRAADDSPAGIDYGEALRRSGLSVLYIPFAREIQPRTDLRCAAALVRVVRQGSFDLVHSHNPKGGLLVPPLARLAGAPAVLHTVHGLLFNDGTRGLHRWAAMAAERWTAAWSHHLLFQSAEDYELARSRRYKSPDRLHLVGNGIDELRFDPELYPEGRATKRRELGYQPEDLVVGMVGRLVREKGYEEYFAMAGRVAAAVPQARFLVVGITEADQTDAVDAARLVAENGLEGRCLLLEQREDMPELYLSMDMAVLPSHREGIPRALMEASSMGLPVVATDIRGCREVIADGHTGLLFPLTDTEAFTAAVRQLTDDADLRRRMGQMGRERIQALYTESATTRRVAACYEAALSAPGAA